MSCWRKLTSALCIVCTEGVCRVATQEYQVGLATIRVHSHTDWTTLTPAEQQVEFDRRLAERDPVALGIAEAVARIYATIEAG